jgi:prolyl-tRNA editing enzyme YbaK/EbsC (Cys-tRNA(Pro) deacylase)
MDSLHSEISCLGGEKDAIRGVASIPWVSETKGGVSPIGWVNSPAIILIDEALNDYEEVWAAAGHPHTVFPTSFSELINVTSAQAAVVGD